MPDASPQAPPNSVLLTQEQYQALQRGNVLLQKLAQGKTKTGFEGLVKELYPEVETTNDIVEVAAKPYIEKLNETTERLNTYLQQQEEKEAAATQAAADTRLSDAFTRLRQEGLTTEGETEVKKLMIERDIADPFAAFALFERNNPPPVDVTASWEPDSWNYSTNAVDHDVEGLFKDPDRWADKEVGNILSELRRPQAL